MSAFLYAVGLQWRLDMRSKSLLITCYIVPLLFFAIMGGIFTSINPNAKHTLIQSMTVMGVSMGAFLGLPPSLVEIYSSDMKKGYTANGIPLSLGLLTTCLSAFIHLFIMSAILYATAILAFDATPPQSLAAYAGALALFIAVSLSIGAVLGLCIKSQAKLTMIAQLIFLPSIMLSGIMFPSDLLPTFLSLVGRIFPAAWGYILLRGETLMGIWPLLITIVAASGLCVLLLRRMQGE